MGFTFVVLVGWCTGSVLARLTGGGGEEVGRSLQDQWYDSRYKVWDFSQQTRPISIPGERADELYGSIISIWDQYMVIGAPGDRSREFASGSVYIYTKRMNYDGSHSWEFLELLEPWDGRDGDDFGCAVDLHMYTLVVGSNLHDENGQDAGAAYIYECYNNAEHHHDEHHHEEAPDEMQRMWYLAAKLMPEEGLPQDYFGSTVATQGNSTAVGAYGSDVLATFSGSVFVWRKTWTFHDPHRPWEWIYDEMIVASDGHRYDFFGTSLAIYDSKLAVGAIGVDEDEMYKVGAVYVYRNTYDDSTDDGLSYQLLDKLTPGESGVTYENFGQSVSMWDENLVVGAPNSNANGVHAAGAFYSYGFDKYGRPYFIEKVLPSSPSHEGHCGYSIDIFKDLAAMGCPNSSGYGSTYIYTEVSPFTTPSTKNIHWLVESQKSTLDTWSKGNMYGNTVSVYEDTVAVGAHKALSGVGAVYLYMGNKKIYQDLFANETDDDDEYIVIVEDKDESIEEILFAFEEAHPRETKAIILGLFCVILLLISVYGKKGREHLEEASVKSRRMENYELTGMDSTHGQSMSGYESSEKDNNESSHHSNSLSSLSAKVKNNDTRYNPITKSETKGSSQRVRDLVAAGLLTKPSEKVASFQPPALKSSPFNSVISKSSSIPEPGQ